MTYASDLGLTVGSKIKIIAPKGTGSEYYDDQDILELTKDNRTPSPIFQNLTKGGLAYFTVGDRTDECISWEHYKEPKLVEETEMNTRLERDREYDVKLTGEEIAIVTVMLAVSSCNVSTAQGDLALNAYKKFKEVSGGFERYGLSLPSILLGSHTSVLTSWLNKVFAVPETEDQRKLRELKEQYESLGKAIDAMEKK